LYDVRYKFSERGELFFEGSFADTDAEFDSLSLYANEPEVITAFFPGGLPVEGPDAGSPLGFADYNFSGINENSDLDYEEFRARLGVDYLVANGIRLFASASYYDVKDNAPYLQDLAGSVFLGRLGAIWTY
jgi:hypothetical protein